jgi:hypothetical protein
MIFFWYLRLQLLGRLPRLSIIANAEQPACEVWAVCTLWAECPGCARLLAPLGIMLTAPPGDPRQQTCLRQGSRKSQDIM